MRKLGTQLWSSASAANALSGPNFSNFFLITSFDKVQVNSLWDTIKLVCDDKD